jgi:hypothetical protein
MTLSVLHIENINQNDTKRECECESEGEDEDNKVGGKKNATT